MSTFMSNLNTMKEDALGPDYSYIDNIKNPESLGMGSSGDLGQITRNVSGLIGYTEVLVTGGGPAQTTPGGLGNKFFLKTGAQCTGTVNGVKESKDRYIYFNNIPNGVNIPGLNINIGGTSSGDGGLNGLIPGVMGGIEKTNPLKLFNAFTTGANPKCVAVNAPITQKREADGWVDVPPDTTETYWMTEGDAKELISRKGSNAAILESFINNNNNSKPRVDKGEIPDDILIQVYYTSLGLLGLYILMKVFEKKDN